MIMMYLAVGYLGVLFFMKSMLYGEKRKMNEHEAFMYYFLCFAGYYMIGALLYANNTAWEEERVIAAFAECFIAAALNGIIPLIAVFGGGFAGFRISKKTKLKWLGWVVGIAVGFLIVVPLYEFAKSIPGVSWRIEEIREKQEEYEDSGYM